MRAYVLGHLTDTGLSHALISMVTRGWRDLAVLLAHLAEFEVRKLFLKSGYSSMSAYCVGELRFSEDAAQRRLRAARAARQYPAIFAAVADGRVNLTTVNMLKPFLSVAKVDELLAAVAYKTKCEVASVLAEKFPRTEMFEMVEVAPAPARVDPPATATSEPAPARVVPAATPSDPARVNASSGVGGRLGEPAPARVVAGPALARVAAAGRSRVRPLSADTVAVHLALPKATYEKMQRAKDLMSHQAAAANLAHVIDRAFDALLALLEKQKFAATSRPRRTARPSTSKRHIPAAVKRAVRKRDGERCTFVGETGHRCGEKKFLQFDHIAPVARGGESTVENLHLRCRAHNLYEADRLFGAEFMAAKREAARTRNSGRIVASQPRTPCYPPPPCP